MQKLKEILMREDERVNLKNIGFCTLVILALVAVAFGIVNMKFLFESSPGGPASGPVATETP